MDTTYKMIVSHDKDELIRAIEEKRYTKRLLCKWFRSNNEFALAFASKFGYEDFIRSFITDPKWAYKWCKEFGPNEKLEKIITKKSARWSYHYAIDFNRPDKMWGGVNEEQFAVKFAVQFEDYQSWMIQYLHSTRAALEWMNEIGYDPRIRDIIEKSSRETVEMWNRKYPTHKMEKKNS